CPTSPRCWCRAARGPAPTRPSRSARARTARSRRRSRTRSSTPAARASPTCRSRLRKCGEACTRAARESPSLRGVGRQVPAISIRFYAELGDFLAPGRRQIAFDQAVKDRASIKDVIESLGVPHTEVDLILVNGESVDFSYHVQDGDRISVYPVFEALDI